MENKNCEHQFKDIYSNDKMTVVECVKKGCGYKKTIIKKKGEF